MRLQHLNIRLQGVDTHHDNEEGNQRSVWSVKNSHTDDGCNHCQTDSWQDTSSRSITEDQDIWNHDVDMNNEQDDLASKIQ